MTVLPFSKKKNCLFTVCKNNFDLKTGALYLQNNKKSWVLGAYISFFIETLESPKDLIQRPIWSVEELPLTSTP